MELYVIVSFFQGWQFNFEDGGIEMRSILVKLGLTALIIGGLAGCGGASIGVNGVTGGSSGSGGTIVAGAVDVRQLSTADFQALRPVVTVQSVTISPSATPGSGTPVVKYKVVDQHGNPIVGLGGQSNNPAQTNVTHVPTNYDISFTLAKLIPATPCPANAVAGQCEPARWVNYAVTKLASTSTPASAVVVNAGVSYTGQYPSADSNGTIVDNGDGTYQYTFLRDITQTQAIIKALPATYTVGSTTYNTSDLDFNKDPNFSDLAYDPTATHRLGVLLTGSQPGTGAAIPGGVAPAGAVPVPLVYTVSLAYDFVPAGGTPTATREIVDANSCNGCHDNVSQKRGLGHISLASATNGIPPGGIVGRNDPKLCVACHTDQTKFGFANVTTTTNTDGSPAYSGSYFRTNTTVTGLDQAAFTYPRMIHQTHMGNQLVRTGYNLNGHAPNCANAAAAGANAAQCFNLVGMPQDQRNCTKCHTGTAITSSDPNAPAPTTVTKDGDNWKNKPSQVACGACHDGINFVTGAGVTLSDRDADLIAGNPVGTTHSGHYGNSSAPSGTLPDNSLCSSCHTASAIAVVHASEVATMNSVGLQTGIQSVAYNIKSVTVNSTTHQPTIVFQILLNGTAVTSLPVQTPVVNAATGATVVNPAFEPLPHLIGGPSFTMYWAVPQDGIKTPADFNGSSSGVSLGALLIDTTKGVSPVSPAAGYLTNTVSGGAFAADSSGYFTAVLTGNLVGQAKGTGCVAPVAPAIASCVVSAVAVSPLLVPTNAVMVTAAMIGGFTQDNLSAYPYTPANVASTVAVAPTATNGCPANPGTAACVTTVAAVGSGVHVTGQLAKMVATGYTARRVITAASLCNNCHEKLGNSRAVADAVYSYKNPAGKSIYDGLGPFFHNGDRNDPTACNFCHNPNRVDSGTGWQVDSSTWLHGIHGASKRTVTYGGAGYDWSTVLYPGQLKDCSQCHLPNTVNYGGGDSSQGGGYTGGTLQPNLLWTTTTTGTALSAASAVAATASYAVVNPQNTLTPSATLTTSQYVTYGQAYGTGFSSTVNAASAVAVVTQAAGTTLVNSPIASACFACHTDQTAVNHMQQTGGGVINSPRSAHLASDGVTLVNTEACLACHGQGTTMDAAVVHQTQ